MTESTQKPETTQDSPIYHRFFEKHGLRVKDSELAEESVRMRDDTFALFSMWKFRGSKDLTSEVPDMPAAGINLELEAINPGPEDAPTHEQLGDDVIHELETSNVRNPHFTMAGYMARMQEARLAANFIKEQTGLDVYKKEDFQKMKFLLENEQDPLLINLLGDTKSVGNDGLYITSNTYKTLQGSKEQPQASAWFDAPLYPKELRESWVERGEYLGWRKSPARLLDPKVMFGEKLGAVVHQWHTGNVLKTMAWDKTKIGSKLIGFGFFLWFATIVLVKRHQLQYRDHITAQLIFAERMHSLEDYYPVTEAAVHRQLRLRGFLQSYYEDEEDEDEEV